MNEILLQAWKIEDYQMFKTLNNLILLESIVELND